MSTLDEIAASPPGLNVTLALATIAASVKATNESLDAFFLLTMAIVVYFMVCGFAFLEAGSVRSKHTTNILLKNVLDSFVGCIAYYLFGWALAFGEPGNSFCGNSFWAMAYLPDNRLALWFFQFVFATTSATIVSGALAERCEFLPGLLHSFLATGFVYPIVSHWAWSPVGWLSVGITAQNGSLVSKFHDFAGSGVVHITGGITSLVAAAILGPRTNRYDPETQALNAIPGHSVPLVSLGGFILFFGFLAFNGGSQGSIQKPGDGAAVATAMINTALSSSVAACTTLAVCRMRSRHWSLLRMVNGGLAGMVAICAGCDVVYPWGACVIGFFAALSYFAWSELVPALRVDDPVEATAVHLGGGLWGVLSVAFLHRHRGILFLWNQQSALDLAVQLVGVLSIVAWTGGTMALFFGIMRLLKVLRVSIELEIKGIDIPKHGEPCYPIAAYGHGWGNDNTSDGGAEVNELSAQSGMQYDQYVTRRKPITKLDAGGISNPTLVMP